MTTHSKDINIILDLNTNLFLGRRNISQKIINVLLKHDSIFVPQKIDIELNKNRPHKISFEDNLEIILNSMIDDDHPGLIGERKKPVKVWYIINITRFRMFDHITITIQDKWFDNAKHLEELLLFSKDLYYEIEASSGIIYNNSTESRYDRIEGFNGQSYFSEPRFPGVKDNLPGLFWANFYGPEYVEMWGRDFLIKSPSFKVEELVDGGMILFLSESPLKTVGRVYELNKEKLYSYLGYEAFNGKRYPKFRTQDRWRKKRNARPLIETGGILDDVFADELF